MQAHRSDPLRFEINDIVIFPPSNANALAMPDQASGLIRKLAEGELPLNIRGRLWGIEELSVVAEIVEQYWACGRTKISEVICERLDWRQPNGWLKDRACRDLLLRLDSLQVLRLPPRLSDGGGTPPNPNQGPDRLSQFDLSTEIRKVRTFGLSLAKGNSLEPVWNQTIDRFHYLGHRSGVGRCLKYLVTAEHDLLGAISFSSPSWMIKSRDHALANLGIAPTQIADHVINNNRFLILPHVRVPNLASRILAAATSQVVFDWGRYYALIPSVVETFVEPSRFNGASYRAANWVQVGTTRGYRKRGRSHVNSQEPKLIFLYGLHRRYRRRLAMLDLHSNVGA